MKEVIGRCFAMLLIGLLLIKVSAFHIYEHQNALDSSASHCEQCVVAIYGQQSEAQITSFPVPEALPKIIRYKDIIISRDNALTHNIAFIVPFSRPPPMI